MAWTTPTTRASGDLVTAAIWNVDLVDNLNYLKTETDKAGALLRDGAEVAVNNTTTETTLFSGSVVGGTLGTAKLLIGRMAFRWDSPTVGRAFTIRVKYGGTTMLTFTSPSIQTNVSALYGVLEFMLRGDGASNAQEAQGQYAYSANGSAGVFGVAALGTAAIDSTAAQNLVITVQHGSTGADTTFTAKGVVIEGAF